MQRSLTVQTEPDGIAQELREIARDVHVPADDWEYASDSPLAGACYAVSEAFYHEGSMYKGKLTPQQVSFEATIDLGVYSETYDVSHWFLEGDNGTIFDLTAEQFWEHDIEIPYDEARGRGFLTKAPSSDAQELLEEI